MQIYLTPQQIKANNTAINKQINKLQQQLASCSCEHTHSMLQHQLMQLITKQAMLGS